MRDRPFKQACVHGVSTDRAEAGRKKLLAGLIPMLFSEVLRVCGMPGGEAVTGDVRGDDRIDPAPAGERAEGTTEVMRRHRAEASPGRRPADPTGDTFRAVIRHRSVEGEHALTSEYGVASERKRSGTPAQAAEVPARGTHLDQDVPPRRWCRALALGHLGQPRPRTASHRATTHGADGDHAGSAGV